MWLEFVGYLVVALGLGVGLRALGAGDGAIVLVGMLVALLLGFEASSLRRWMLARRGWTDLGVVIGDDIESAERRFFDVWTAQSPQPAAPKTPLAGITARPAPEADVIGLFPHPGAQP